MRKLVSKPRTRTPSTAKVNNNRGYRTSNSALKSNGVQPLDLAKQLTKISQTPTSNLATKSAPVNSSQVHGEKWDDVINEINQNSRSDDIIKQAHERLAQHKAGGDPFSHAHQSQPKTPLENHAHGETWDEVVNEIEQKGRGDDLIKQVHERLALNKAGGDAFLPEPQPQLKTPREKAASDSSLRPAPTVKSDRIAKDNANYKMHYDHHSFVERASPFAQNRLTDEETIKWIEMRIQEKQMSDMKSSSDPLHPGHKQLHPQHKQLLDRETKLWDQLHEIHKYFKDKVACSDPLQFDKKQPTLDYEHVGGDTQTNMWNELQKILKYPKDKVNAGDLMHPDHKQL